MWTKTKNKEKRNTHDHESDPSYSKQFTELVQLFLLFHVPKNQNPTTQNEPTRRARKHVKEIVV